MGGIVKILLIAVLLIFAYNKILPKNENKKCIFMGDGCYWFYLGPVAIPVLDDNEKMIPCKCED